MLETLDDAVAELAEVGLGELLRQRLVREVAVGNPGAGVEWSQSVPAGTLWELLAVHANFLASAAVANRQPQLSVKNPNGVRTRLFSNGVVVAAAGNVEYDYEAGLGYVNGASPFVFGLPSAPILMLSGAIVGSLTSNLDVGDAYSNVIVTVRQWAIEDVLLASKWFGRHTR